MPSWWSDPSPKNAFVLSWVSVLLTFIAAFTGLTFYIASGSALCLVFGLENCVDFLSSVVVLWRFYCPGKVTAEQEELLKKREKRASIAISFILIALGISVISAAVDDLVTGAENEYELQLVIATSFVSVFIFGSLMCIKFQYAEKLDSASLYKDGICSAIGCTLAVALFVNTLIVERYPDIWWLDPAVAIVCGAGALLIGLQAVIVASCMQRLPIFSLKWWMTSQGDGLDEVRDRALSQEDFGDVQMPADKMFA
jgi:divalent metal cation (Fe/Co/Zn/Cd) transporter